MKVEPFGGNTLLLAGYPAMLANMGPIEVLRALLERILSGGKQPDRRNLLDDLLHTIACKAAIKAGDRLRRRRLRPCWSSVIWSTTPTIVPTAAPPRWSSRGKNWTSNSSGVARAYLPVVGPLGCPPNAMQP